MTKQSDAKRKIWIAVIFAAAIDLITTLFSGGPMFGNSSKGKK